MTKGSYLICFFSAALIIVESKYLQHESEVVFVNAVFRHGDRVPSDIFYFKNSKDMYPPTVFNPPGLGQLTNNGKLRAYQLGQMLRNRYDKFLGDIYYLGNVYARSTAVVRSKMSLLLVLAGLYPPSDSQKWYPGLNWQPINSVTVPYYQDGLLLPLSCARLRNAINDVANTKEVTEKLNQYDNLARKLTTATETNITGLWDLYNLYHTLDAIRHMDLPLPDWADDIFPHGQLRDAAVLQYQLFSYTTEINRQNGGVLLHRVIEDMRKIINGVNDTKGRKINLFCGQELIIAGFLNALGIYDNIIPQYCSTVLMELHKKDDQFYIKVLYHLGNPLETKIMKIPGCEELCPFEKFVELRKNVTASGDDLQCDTRVVEDLI